MSGRDIMRSSGLLLLAALSGSACVRGVDASSCGTGEILATDAYGRLTCTARPVGFPVPVCTSALTSDGNKVLCSRPEELSLEDSAARAELDRLDSQLVALQAKFQAAKSPSPKGYLGPSKLATTGSFFSGLIEGVAAATRMCSADYGSGAHLCTLEGLYQSAAAGTLSATSTIAPSWVYAPNWNEPIAMPVSPMQGISDNCASYTDHSGYQHHSGILVEWRLLPDGSPGFRWNGGTAALCYSSHPVACCR